MNRMWTTSGSGHETCEEGRTDRESTTIEIEDHVEEPIITNISHTNCLVGRLVALKQPNGFHLMEVMKKSWKSLKDVTAREWKKKLFLFNFATNTDREWVLKQQPWHFDDHLFIVAPLDGSIQPSNIVLNRCSFWVRAYDLPIKCMKTTTLQNIAKRIGDIEEIDTLDKFSRCFARFKISVDITQPILRGITIMFEGNKLWIPLKFESLPIYCFKCGIMGHQSRQCEQEDEEDEGEDDLKYGSWLKASPLKKI